MICIPGWAIPSSERSPDRGLDEAITGVLPAIEPVASATFRLPGRKDLGNFTSGRMLRDPARLSTSAVAGPFRNFGRIAVELRPNPLVPLMMAAKLDVVRMLIADAALSRPIELSPLHRAIRNSRIGAGC